MCVVFRTKLITASIVELRSMPFALHGHRLRRYPAQPPLRRIRQLCREVRWCCQSRSQVVLCFALLATCSAESGSPKQLLTWTAARHVTGAVAL